MDKQTIQNMLAPEPIAKNPRLLICSKCGITVKVSRYRSNESYKCNSCRYPKPERTSNGRG